MKIVINYVLDMTGVDHNDPGDLEDFVKLLSVLCIVAFIIGAFIIMATGIFGNSSPPPEPEFWLRFEAWLFS